MSLYKERTNNQHKPGEDRRKGTDECGTGIYIVVHVTDIDNLRECYKALDGRKAPGFDGVTKAMYGENLEANLQELSDKLKRMGYIPKPKRIYVDSSTTSTTK